MTNNSNLHTAKKEKNDCFYTQLEDIEKEMVNYVPFFEGKVVYCNCDDYRLSNFTKCFKDNFEYLKLKKVICTNYDNGNGAWKYEYDGENETIIQLEGNGSFDSKECIAFLKEADVVVTNPPFSLFRDYVKQLMDYNKKFLIIGNTNAITYKEIFPYIKDNELWLGVSSFNVGMYFNVPQNYQYADTYKFDRERNGKKVIRVSSVCWFTNISHNKRNTPLDLYKKYNEKEFPHYDNYNAIEVSKVTDIPEDYDGVMGVPITFLDKYNPKQFMIVGWSRHNDLEMDGGYWQGGKADATINGKEVYRRILIRKLS